MKKLLIYVPTYEGGERLAFFVSRFISEARGFEDEVDLHLSDNCSEKFHPPVDVKNIFYSINATNIGIPRNVNKVFNINSSYEYTWVLGDDDYLVDGSISRILNILKSYNPSFLCLNTVSYPGDLRNSIIQNFSISGELPVENAVLKSSLSIDDIFHTKFSNLIDNRVDDVLLGSIMCGVFRSADVKDFSSINFDNSNILNVFSAYPHIINYANSFSNDPYSILDPFVHTFNFWNGGNTWREQYDVVVGFGLLYSIKSYYDSGLLTDESESQLIKHYFSIGRKSLDKLNKSTDPNLSAQSAVVLPYLIDAIIRLKLV